MTRRFMLPAALVALMALAGCSRNPSGTYAGEGNAIFDSLTFKDGNKVELVFLGAAAEAAYTVEGDSVRITHTGQTHVFTFDEAGCLDGGIAGKYCKK